MLESSLLGAGASYGYLACSTLGAALATSAITAATLTSPPRAWAIVFFFFVLRLSASAGRLFISKGGGGFGAWRTRRDGAAW